MAECGSCQMQRERKCQRDCGSEAEQLMLSNERNKGNYPQKMQREQIGKLTTEYLKEDCYLGYLTNEKEDKQQKDER